MGATKEMHIEIKNQLLQWENDFHEGDIDVMDVYVQMEEQRKYLEASLEIINKFKDENLDIISGKAHEYPNGHRGYKFEVRSGGRIFSFKHIPEWQTYQEALKNCEERHKQAFISAEKGLLTATEDGEEIVMPEISYRKSSIILKPIM